MSAAGAPRQPYVPCQSVRQRGAGRRLRDAIEDVGAEHAEEDAEEDPDDTDDAEEDTDDADEDAAADSLLLETAEVPSARRTVV